jgi:uncharacterized protein (DUF58 family)
MHPTRRLIILVLAAAPLFLAGALITAFVGIGVLYVLALVLCVSGDALIRPRSKQLMITRRMPERISLGIPTRVVFEIRNESRRSLDIHLAENLPAELSAHPARLHVHLAGRQKVELAYQLTAQKRGRFSLGEVFVRTLPSRGLLYRQYTLTLMAPVQVFPNLTNLKRCDLLARRGLILEGLARQRSIGQGSEFESLRHYVIGDGLSHVDWKATAKRDRLIVKNYEPQRQQNILVAIDVGRATGGEFDRLSRVDYLVNATLMLAYVALRQRDRFSLVAFSDRIECYLPSIAGMQNIDRVAQALYPLQGRRVESNYGLACRFLGLRHRKRSLICVMTDIINKEASDVLLGYMARFARYHLPLLVLLSDPRISELAHRPLSQKADPYVQAAAIDVMAARKEALVSMRRKGVSVLDVHPNQLTTDLINRYTLIKTSNRL